MILGGKEMGRARTVLPVKAWRDLMTGMLSMRAYIMTSE
jgi:hypothetical protein